LLALMKYLINRAAQYADFLSLISERMLEYFNVPSFEGEYTHTHTHTPEAVLTLVTLSKTRSLWPSEEED